MALGVAEKYSVEKRRVWLTKNGWYAIVQGPYTSSPSELEQTLSKNIRDNVVPSDSYYSNGMDFVKELTKPEVDTPESSYLRYNGRDDIQGAFGALRVTITKQTLPDSDKTFPVATGMVNNKKAFEVSFNMEPYAPPAADFFRVELGGIDPAMPQFMFIFYSGGMDCCFQGKVVYQISSGGWKIIDLPETDQYYELAEIGPSAGAIILARDRRMTEHFGVIYGSSNVSPPFKGYRISGGKLVGVSGESELHHILVQDVYADDPFRLTTSNGVTTAF